MTQGWARSGVTFRERKPSLAFARHGYINARRIRLPARPCRRSHTGREPSPSREASDSVRTPRGPSARHRIAVDSHELFTATTERTVGAGRFHLSRSYRTRYVRKKYRSAAQSCFPGSCRSSFPPLLDPAPYVRISHPRRRSRSSRVVCFVQSRRYLERPPGHGDLSGPDGDKLLRGHLDSVSG
jgi:hypothetical protein